tara:strand:+ start:36504 stop:37217 length:714 start_codon:yes stop_codon:yes gene_type:complete
MKLLSPPRISPEEKCPYIESKLARHEFFLASELSEEELEVCLSKGYRKFGIYYFRPSCLNCFDCVPIRTRVDLFKPNKSQKRILKKNKDLEIKYRTLTFKEEIFELYKLHSKERFNYSDEKIESREEFIQTHFTPSAPGMVVEYWLKDKLLAVGFIDISDESISSVYFIYHPDYKDRGLGIFGALKEIEYCKALSKKYYYLGYFVKENNFMNYKDQFRPFELYDWKKENWNLHEERI